MSLQNLCLPSDVRCGMVLPRIDRQAALDYSRRIEAAGFDSMWVGDHISFHIPILEALTLLSFAAAVTERVRLGTSVLLLPLRHPTLTAKMTSTLDLLSGGRFTLGIGVGGEFPPEFEAVGVPVKERGSRTDEAIEIIRKLWTGEKVGHEGKHFRFGPVKLDPPPLQKGGPPILVGGRKGATFRRAGQHGDGYISHMCSTEQLAGNLKVMDEQAGKFGRTNVPFETASYLFTFPDDSYERAHDRATAMLERIYNVPFRAASKKYCLLGRPEDFLEQMQRFVDAGSRRFIFSVPEDPGGFVDIYEKLIGPRLGELKVPG